jgi:hypothetical protein
MQQTSLKITTQQAIAFLNQIEGKLDDANTIAELQAVDAELINFESSAGFNHLPTEIIQRFDALQNLVESIEASSVNDSSERSIAEHPIAQTELEKLAKEYAERLAHASTLEHQARTLTTAASMYETFAFERYENAFEQGASEDGWNAAVQSARAELHQNHLEEVVSIAVRVLNSAEADEVRWDGKVITFIRDENRLAIVDDAGHCVVNATWAGEHWEHQASSLSQAEFLTFKHEIETHLSERVRARNAEQQTELQDILELD